MSKVRNGWSSSSSIRFCPWSNWRLLLGESRRGFHKNSGFFTFFFEVFRDFFLGRKVFGENRNSAFDRARRALFQSNVGLTLSNAWANPFRKNSNLDRGYPTSFSGDLSTHKIYKNFFLFCLFTLIQVVCLSPLRSFLNDFIFIVVFFYNSFVLINSQVERYGLRIRQ